MNIEKAEAIVDKLNDKGIEARLHEGYSGRGMYGATTTGVIVADRTAAVAICPELATCRWDSLGFDTILY